MPRILNRPPTFPKKNKLPLFTVSSTTRTSPSITSSGLSRSQRSTFLEDMTLVESTRSACSKQSASSQTTYDTMSSFSRDDRRPAQQHAQSNENDWGYFIDIMGPEERDDRSFLPWR